MAQLRTRTYTGIFYPGEGVVPLVPLIQHMKTIGLPGIISPIHSADGEEAKPHVHFMVDYPNPVRMETVRSDYGAVSANGYLEPVRSRKQTMRYFLHLDHPEKEQDLDPEDVLTIGGAVFDPNLDLTPDDVLRIKIEIHNYCTENEIKEYSHLCEISLAMDKLDWFRVATTCTIHFNAYFRSVRHRNDQP